MLGENIRLVSDFGDDPADSFFRFFRNAAAAVNNPVNRPNRNVGPTGNLFDC
jgi:hypothetical protein